MDDTSLMFARAMVLSLALALASLVAACAPVGGEATPATTEPPTTEPATTERATTQPPTTEPATTEPPAGGPDTPTATPTSPGQPTVGLPQEAWRTAQLVDVRSGETLAINDLQGRLVVIEPMAIWCTSCRAQQNEARAALASLARDDIVYISLDVDPNETEPDLARYADERGYPWHFAVASREVARSLAQTFGDQVLAPPSTPKIVIDPDGSAEVSFGIKRAAELEADFTARLP